MGPEDQCVSLVLVLVHEAAQNESYTLKPDQMKYRLKCHFCPHSAVRLCA